MLKYTVTFSTNNNNGAEKTSEYVKNLTVQLLECAGIDGATLTKNLAGVWQGQCEDSYTLIILSDDDITVKVHALALNIKTCLKQQSVIVEKLLTDTKFI